MDPEVRKIEVLEELQKIAKMMQSSYGDTTLKAALHNRNVALGRLTVLGYEIDHWHTSKAAEISDADPKMPEWKRNQSVELTEEGRIYRFKKQIAETLKIQCDNISGEMIEVMSDRKHNPRAS